jgi:hypothetical protein
VYPNLSVVLSWLQEYATGCRVANGTNSGRHVAGYFHPTGVSVPISKPPFTTAIAIRYMNSKGQFTHDISHSYTSMCIYNPCLWGRG